MPRILSVTNKLLSLRGRIHFTDDEGAMAYEAVGELALLSPTWRIFVGTQGERPPLATVRRRILAWRPTWDIDTGDGSFEIRRTLFSWTPRYRAIGGPWDGARIEGNLWQLNFTITHDGVTLATAAGKILSLRDRHRVQIFGEGERFVVIAMLVLQLDRRERESND